MFKKEINKKKIIAACLIFCFVFTNCFTLFSSINFAKTSELGKQDSENVSKNVEYDVTFMQNEEEKGYEFEGAVSEENLAIHVKTEVKKEGYLKNAKILIESENGLSFDISQNSEDKYQVNENQVELSNIASGEKLDLVLPIQYKEREDIQNLNKKVNVKLIGTYVDNSGEEKSIYENVVLRLKWNTNTEFNISSNLTKYIPYTSETKSGVIIQTVVKSEIPLNNLFVRKEEIEVQGIKLEGYELDKVSVSTKSTEELLENWNYDEANNKINIKLEKDSETIKSEEFLITYVFSGEKELVLPIKASSKINGTISMFGTEETSTSELEAEYEVTEKVGEIITVEGKQTEEVKIGNLLANSVSEQKEYKINYEEELITDISSTSMVEGILIKDNGEEFENEEGKFETKTSYYKSIKVSKENFEKILGNEGSIEVLNANSEVISTITKNTAVDAENNFILNFENKENKINIKTSKPVSEGILNIKLNKEMAETEYSKEQLKTFSNINLKYNASIIYSGNIENKVSEIETKTKLIKPETKADISISRKSLSTITENNDVKMTLALNNTNEDIDLYKNPSFEIKFPEYVENVEITNLAIANAEESFNIADSKLYKDAEGRIVLNIKLEGLQTKYNSNNIANGTNIVISANIKLNTYAPSRQEKIEMRYINENVTSYENIAEDGRGYAETTIEYKAPTGVVSVNKISNYNDKGSILESVEQGKITDKIEIFDEAKIATMDILVMNNNLNNCGNIKILGRIPFKGNREIKTGADLGTTVDTTLVDRLTQNAENLSQATIYYSTNENATEDLENPANDWKTEIEDASKIKSYLIIPNDYEMKPGEVLRYSYQFRIPENLEHNANIYGSFETIYDNLDEVATVKEISTPDIIGLTTGVGPQISATISSNIKESVKEYEKIKYTVTVENTGTEVAKNVVVKTAIPEGTTLASHATQSTVEEAKGWTLKANREILTTIETINPKEIKKIEFFVQVNKLPSIEEYYSNKEGFTKKEDGTYCIVEEYTDENGEIKYKENAISELPEVVLNCNSTITAQDLAKEITKSGSGIKVEESKIVAEETITTEESIAKVNETIETKIQIKNNSDETMKNIVVTKVLPGALNYGESYIRGYEENGITIKKIKTTNYDMDTRTITWTIESLEPGRTAILIGNLVVGEMKENVYKDTISTISTIKVNNEEYQAGQVDITIGRPYLTIEQTSSQTNQYVKVGDEIEYIFNVKNIGSVRANNVMFRANLPKEVKIKKLVYTADGVEVSKVVAQNEDATVYTSILPESEMEVRITVKAQDIDAKQKTIENQAEISATNVAKISSNKITNIIERTAINDDENNNIITEDKNNQPETKPENKPENSKDESIKTKYEIKGTVWLDKNKNGSRDSGENKLSGIEVKLVNAITGELISKIATTQDGEYEFTNLENGAYIAIFYYDNERYALTSYKKQGIADNKNSDVIAVKEESRNVATTDAIAINNGSKSNIDMGLVEATTFDLSLTKTITKVTVQTSKETKSYDFDNANLAKVDINAKYLDGAKIFVEYSFTVKNEGEVEGYAKKLIDFKPKELEFSTELNKDWYIGNDGNLYTESLAETAIAAGQSKTVKLVLTKNMTETNTGIVNNQAEIAESYNKIGIADIDSDTFDRDPKDDDMSSADLIVGVKTGETLIYFSVIITLVIAGIVAIIVIKKSKIILKIQLKFGKEA